MVWYGMVSSHYSFDWFIPLFPLRSLLHPLPTYRQWPGDSSELSLGVKKNHEEEDSGENPQCDGHEHHPAIGWM